MRVYDNGIYRDMTAEEIAEQEHIQADVGEPSKALGEQVAELREALDLLISGVTE